MNCAQCEALCQVDLKFADGKRSYTRQFERHVFDLCRITTVSHVTKRLNLDWHTVKDIEKRGLLRKYNKPRLKDLTVLAIDEINVGKPYKYLTIVMDWITGAVVFVGRGKSGDSLKPFWKSLRSSGASIEAVAMDMSRAYTRAVQDELKGAQIVYDPFHVIKLMNKKLTQLRRDLQREAAAHFKKELKGIRWLLVSNPENLNDERDERKRLEEALKLNAPLATAYYLKEDLRTFWSLKSKAEAKKFLKGWITRAEASGIQILKSFAKTIAVHRHGLLAYYDYAITNGPLEGTNNKIKAMLHQACGYRDFVYFALKIKSIHTTKHRLISA
jgi:transposase